MPVAPEPREETADRVRPGVEAVLPMTMPPRAPLPQQSDGLPSTSIWATLWKRRQVLIAIIALAGIAAHLILRFAVHTSSYTSTLPLTAVLALGGTPLVLELLVKLYKRQFGSDLLAGISIVTSILLGEYLAGSIVVLMLSGGEALESYAVRRASSVLRALANRMPSIAHRHSSDNNTFEDIPLNQIAINDTLLIFPHEICPVDGLVIEGHGTMDESYLTGEPFRMSKTPGSEVLSGAINGESAITIRASKLAVDSRYAKIMQVMRASEQQRPRLRRLGDQLGAFYTPLAVPSPLSPGHGAASRRDS
jgi:cation transport ATPase